MTSLRLLCALALLSLLAPTAARAQIPEGVQRVLLLVVGNDGPASARRAEQAFQHELESRQLEVVVQREPERRRGELPVVHDCISGPCLEQRLSEAHAQLFVGMGVWLQREQPQIVVTLDDGRGPVNVSERFEPGESDAHFARRVLDQALHLYHGRHGVPLRVEGTPHGASVVIDHRPLGTLPLVTHLPPGPHDITVAHVDYVTQRRHVELGADGDELTITLEPEAEAAVTPPDASTTPSAPQRSHPIVGPVLLFVAAAAGVAGGAYGLTRAG
ncbi:MAG: PEGA domain-containing protein, partial [Deltaproteobacteria bacterium]|nr:PEGA domain-containing protein [Deltaproteobacteria bacterium]